jgi:hypothetical protein
MFSILSQFFLQIASTFFVRAVPPCEPPESPRRLGARPLATSIVLLIAAMIVTLLFGVSTPKNNLHENIYVCLEQGPLTTIPQQVVVYAGNSVGGLAYLEPISMTLANRPDYWNEGTSLLVSFEHREKRRAFRIWGVVERRRGVLMAVLPITEDSLLRELERLNHVNPTLGLVSCRVPFGPSVSMMLRHSPSLQTIRATRSVHRHAERSLHPA